MYGIYMNGLQPHDRAPAGHEQAALRSHYAKDSGGSKYFSMTITLNFYVYNLCNLFMLNCHVSLLYGLLCFKSCEYICSIIMLYYQHALFMFQKDMQAYNCIQFFTISPVMLKNSGVVGNSRLLEFHENLKMKIFKRKKL